MCVPGGLAGEPEMLDAEFVTGTFEFDKIVTLVGQGSQEI